MNCLDGTKVWFIDNSKTTPRAKLRKTIVGACGNLAKAADHGEETMIWKVTYKGHLDLNS